MQPLSIVAAFTFLGALSMIGALMLVMSSRRMLKLVGNPHFSWQHIREQGASVTMVAQVFMLTLGVLVLGLGIRGIYRLIWVA